jgi:hypothetical protein
MEDFSLIILPLLEGLFNNETIIKMFEDENRIKIKETIMKLIS